ncbi:MAG TPA: hypothetical protein VGL82_04485 [Bryobacteraceae bacterium]
MRPTTCLFISICVSLAAGVASGREPVWPRVLNSGGARIVVYEPQPDSLDGARLESRVAVSMQRPNDNAPLIGAMWVITSLDISRAPALVRVVSVKVERTRFTGVPESDIRSLVHFLEGNLPLWDVSASYTRLKASLQPVGGSAGPGFRDDPPKIIVTDHPAILLLLDGEPRLQTVGSNGLQRVVNTALPVVFDPESKRYWLYGSSGWFTSDNLLRGNWTWSDRAPSSVGDLVRDNETLAPAQSDAGSVASVTQLRNAKIIVATEPTELIVTEGPPKYIPLVGGEILYVTNTDSDIFMDVATQRHYLAISGRWFAGPSLHGPWSFVAPEHLPAGFSHIPENSAKAEDLAFIPGTDRARDALLDNSIPQTAEVSRTDARIDVQYDGPPQFTSIPNTPLEYAENTPSQVIRSGAIYYACEDGIWYSAPSPSGPWSVSTVRPAGIDDVPPSSPVYNTKYVYIYDWTPAVVHVGYLPAYRWSFPYHRVIVYGTGWRYRSWFGRYYYPRPVTWGFFARYHPWDGWGFGMSWTAGWLGLTAHWGYGWAGWAPVYGVVYRPGFWSGFYAGGWFGPGGYRPPRPPSWHPPGRPAPGRPPGSGPRPGNNLYVRPGQTWVRPRPGTLPAQPQQGRPPRPNGDSPRGGRGGAGGGAGRGASPMPGPGSSTPGRLEIGPRPGRPPIQPGGAAPRGGRGDGGGGTGWPTRPGAVTKRDDPRPRPLPGPPQLAVPPQIQPRGGRGDGGRGPARPSLSDSETRPGGGRQGSPRSGSRPGAPPSAPDRAAPQGNPGGRTGGGSSAGPQSQNQ